MTLPTTQLSPEIVAIILSLKDVPRDVSELKIKLAEHTAVEKQQREMLQHLHETVEGNGKPGLRADMLENRNQIKTLEDKLTKHVENKPPWWVAGIVSPLVVTGVIAFAGFILYLYVLHPSAIP